MLKKKINPSGKTVRVEFSLPADVKAESACLCGDFNDWDRDKYPMTKLKDGSFRLQLSLESGKQYEFRYLLDGERWENDWQSDEYCANEFGTENSVVILDSIDNDPRSS
jgi:1,4-alpha-glucan branching enzyme